MLGYPASDDFDPCPKGVLSTGWSTSFVLAGEFDGNTIAVGRRTAGTVQEIVAAGYDVVGFWSDEIKAAVGCGSM